MACFFGSGGAGGDGEGSVVVHQTRGPWSGYGYFVCDALQCGLVRACKGPALHACMHGAGASGCGATAPVTARFTESHATQHSLERLPSDGSPGRAPWAGPLGGRFLAPGPRRDAQAAAAECCCWRAPDVDADGVVCSPERLPRPRAAMKRRAGLPWTGFAVWMRRADGTYPSSAVAGHPAGTGHPWSRIPIRRKMRRQGAFRCDPAAPRAAVVVGDGGGGVIRGAACKPWPSAPSFAVFVPRLDLNWNSLSAPVPLSSIRLRLQLRAPLEANARLTTALGEPSSLGVQRWYDPPPGLGPIVSSEAGSRHA
ncbi:hypothetical protein TOPH_02026 [Tolypocladium ophioglossoides CBS 100239]|uniref:Uncharacterized protein n=1 Tax=Tolypocladium ophioglossoides (strain CBS 100239) TaxID=1163406 RepID=A0A0L0NHQ2_TOLOC|nr:hypothetical protein TOPH_02026 [Tolypocladium ophioglossoides CBS 100239]